MMLMYFFRGENLSIATDGQLDENFIKRIEDSLGGKKFFMANLEKDKKVMIFLETDCSLLYIKEIDQKTLDEIINAQRKAMDGQRITPASQLLKIPQGGRRGH